MGSREAREQVGGPVEPGSAEEAVGEMFRAMLGEQRVDALDPFGPGGAAQRERERSEPQLEQAVPAGGLEVVVALGRCPADELDLPRPWSIESPLEKPEGEQLALQDPGNDGSGEKQDPKRQGPKKNGGSRDPGERDPADALNAALEAEVNEA